MFGKKADKGYLKVSKIIISAANEIIKTIRYPNRFESLNLVFF